MPQVLTVSHPFRDISTAKIYTFTCPECHKFFRTLDPGEPMCTGPSESRDDHEMILMRLHKIEDVEVPLQFAENRANNPLIMPDMTTRIEQEIRLLKA